MTQSNAELVREYLRAHPKAATKTLADRIYADHPARFLSAEGCRDAVRYVRGAKGKAARRKVAAKNAGVLRPPQPSGDPFEKLPEPWQEMPNWGEVILSGPRRVLVLQDVHIPYHDKQALLVALHYGRDRGVDTVLLNGDLFDFYRLSDFMIDPERRSFAEELSAARQFLETLREAFPKAQIVFKWGNHEERYVRYMRVKALALLGIDDFRLGSVLKFDQLRIIEVGQMRPICLGKLRVIHGHEYRFPISNPVSPARGLFLRAKVHALCGHFHQISSYKAKTLGGEVVGCWSAGCLCNLHPEYRPHNEWSHGFSLVEVTEDGAFEVNNLAIIHGKAYAA